MGRKRDAGTGVYISNEEAAMRDSNTWVEESDAPSIRTILNEVYEKCASQTIKPTEGYILNGVESLPLFVLKSVLNEYGAKIK